VVAGGGLLFSATLIFMYPIGAADLFDQIFRARELAVYGQNPFLVPPSNLRFAHDPFRAFVGSWADTTSPYGPVWETLAALTAKLAGDDLWRNLIAFKALVIAAYAAAAGLIYAALRRVRPGWAARGLLLFAWNPLVLWETAGNGHNDMVMVAFMLLALYLLARGGRMALLAPAALALAALCKFVPALLLPALLAAIWQLRTHNLSITPFREEGDDSPSASGMGVGELGQSLAAVLASAAGFALVIVLCYAPFWGGMQTVGALARTDLFTASIPNALKDWLSVSLDLGDAQAARLVRAAVMVVVGTSAIMVAAWLLIWPRRTQERMVLAAYRACYAVLFVYLVAGTLWFQPWYQSWLVALTPLAARHALSKRTMVLNGGGIANYFVWDYLVLWNYSWGNVIQATAALVVNGPVLLYTLYQWLTPPARRARRPATSLSSSQRNTLPYDRP
jgi:hypothetical protein